MISFEKKKRIAGYGFISIWFIGFIFLFLIPFINSFVFSISELEFGDGLRISLVGFGKYYNALFKDAMFVRLLVSSLNGIFLQVPIIVIFSLFIACMLNQNLKGRTFFRVIFFLPVIIANGVIIGIIRSDPLSGSILNNGSSSGLFLNESFQIFLLNAGLPQNFVSSLIDLINNVFELVWKSGIQILLCIAGLQNVSPQLYEAAQIEGGSSWEIFWKITFPMVSPILMVCVVYTVIDSFTDYSNSLMQFIINTASRLNFEYSSTMACIYFVLIAFIVGIVYAIVNKRIFYMNE